MIFVYIIKNTASEENTMKKMKTEKRLIWIQALLVITCIIIYLTTKILITLALAFIALLGVGFQFLRYQNAKKEFDQN